MDYSSLSGKSKKGNQILSEDLYKITTDLEIFEKYKQSLKPELRDINRYDLHSLQEWTKNFQDKVDHVELLKQKATAEILSQTTILYDGPEGMALIPHSKLSAMFWGKNTRLCTSFKGADNQFHHYNIDAPLIMLFPNEGMRYQLHVNVMHDENDDKVVSISKPLDALALKLLELYPQNVVPKGIDVSIEDDVPEEYELDSRLNNTIEKIKQHPDNQWLVLQSLKLAAPELESFASDIMHAVDEKLKSNKEFMKEAIDIDSWCYAYGSSEVLHDPEIIKRLIDRDVKCIGDIPVKAWEVFPASDKRAAWDKAVKEDYRYISYAEDFNVQIDIETERKIFERAYIMEDEEDLLKYCYMFPSLRPACFAQDFDLDKAWGIYEDMLSRNAYGAIAHPGFRLSPE